MLHNHRPKQPPTSSSARWATMSDPNFCPETLARNLGASFGVADKPFLSLITRFITGLRGTIANLEPYQVQAYYDSCKLRYSELYKLISRLLDLSQTYEVSLTRANGKPFIQEASETEIHFTPYEGEEVVLDLRLNGHPKVYGILSKALLRAIICAAQEGYRPEDYPQALLPYLQIILSVGQLYDDLRGDRRVVNLLERQALEKMLGTSKPLKLVLEYWDTLIEDINKGRQAPPYIRDIARSLPWVDKSPFTPDDYHVSLRSTGTSKGNRPLNGLLASIYETDIHWDYDDLIGYKSYYRAEAVPDVKQYNRKTITIEQKKLKRRVIHMACNGIQDRCNWYHRRLEKILRRVDSDCTWNQDAGRQFARRATRDAEAANRNIYSCDISSATDTISLEFQEMVIALFLGPDHAKAWRSIASGASVFCFNDRHEQAFETSRGQFQGYKSSFPSFALAHHILMRILMLATGNTNLYPKDFYRVLGDDSIVYCYDPERKVRDMYHALCEDIGWEVNTSKGYYYYADEEALPVAEFAKVRYCQDRALSPLPLMLTLNLYEDKGLIPAMLFIAKHLAQVDIFHAISIADMSGISLYQMYYVMLMIHHKLGPWSYIEDNSSMREISDEEVSTFLIGYFKTQLQRTTLSLWLPTEYEYDLMEGWDLAKKNSIIFLEGIADAEKAADLDTNHKIWYLMDKQDRLIHLLEQAIGDATLNYAGLGFDLSPKDMSTIEAACEILVDFKSASPESIRSIIPNAIEILSRFNPRSDSLNSRHESSTISSNAIDCVMSLDVSSEQILADLACAGYGEVPQLDLDTVLNNLSTDEEPSSELEGDLMSLLGDALTGITEAPADWWEGSTGFAT